MAKVLLKCIQHKLCYINMSAACMYKFVVLR